MVLVAAATVPVLFLFVVARGQGRHSVAIAGTLLGVYWIGMAVTLAVSAARTAPRQEPC